MTIYTINAAIASLFLSLFLSVPLPSFSLSLSSNSCRANHSLFFPLLTVAMRNLFQDNNSQRDDGDEERPTVTFKINRDYAQRFEANKQREELHRRNHAKNEFWLIV
jgi:hypothetical protein